MPKFTRKATITAVTAALVLGVSGTAFAYWSMTGSGTGTATNGTATTPLIVNQTVPLTSLYPGGAAVALSGTFTNNNQSAVSVGGVSAVVSTTSLPTTCLASWYSIGGSSTVTQSVPVGTGVASWSGLTVSMPANATTNQDPCKLATITITYTVLAPVPTP